MKTAFAAGEAYHPQCLPEGYTVKDKDVYVVESLDETRRCSACRGKLTESPAPAKSDWFTLKGVPVQLHQLDQSLREEASSLQGGLPWEAMEALGWTREEVLKAQIPLLPFGTPKPTWGPKTESLVDMVGLGVVLMTAYNLIAGVIRLLATLMRNYDEETQSFKVDPSVYAEVSKQYDMAMEAQREIERSRS